MRKQRSASIAGIMATLMALLAVCPCAPASPPDHDCCAGTTALTIDAATPSCCLEDARDPRLGETGRRAPSPAGESNPPVQADGVEVAMPDVPARATSYSPSAIPPTLRI